MAKRICILCGKEVGMWNQAFIKLCETNQVLCGACMEKYRGTTGDEKVQYQERMVRSPHLMDRAEVLANLPKEREKWAQSREQEEQKQQRVVQRRERLGTVMRCCDQAMTERGVSTFQLGEHSFWLGDLDHLASGSMRLAVFRCEICGQVKFYDPEFVK